MFYYLDIRFANSELNTAKEKLEIVASFQEAKTAKEPEEKHRPEPYFNFGGRKFFNPFNHMNEDKQPITDPTLSARQPHKYLGILGMLWITFLIMSTFTVLKTFTLGPWVFSVAILAYPFTYIFADIFTEVYGYRVTRKIVWTGFLCLAIASGLGYLYTIIPPSASFTLQNEFATIFRLGPIVTLATIAAFFTGELTNSFVLAKGKIFTSGKQQWLRLIGSTFAGQLVDNTVGFVIIFAASGVFAQHEIIPLIISSVLFCTIWETIALPITYRVIAFIKRKEGLDTYDKGTNFNPFALRQ